MRFLKITFYITLSGVFFFIIYLLSSGWAIPKKFEANRSDLWISKSWIANLLIEPGSKIIYHRKRIGWSKWQLDGEYTIYYNDGSKFIEGEFKNGTWSREEISWHKNGNKSGVNYYKDGIHYGKSINWDEVGNKIREVNYVNGQKHNEENYWHSDGSLAVKNIWEKGELNKIVFYKNNEIEKILVGEELKNYILEKIED